MKKYFIILLVGIMSGCASNQTFIQVSPVAKKTINGNHVYFINNETGSMCYRFNIAGLWKDKQKVHYHLVDSATFFQIPVKTSVSASVETSNSNIVIK